MCIAGPAFLKPAHMLYNMQHCSPELLNASTDALKTRIDARAQDMWSTGSLLLYTLTQRSWFTPPHQDEDQECARAELVQDMTDLHGAWVSSCQ